MSRTLTSRVAPVLVLAAVLVVSACGGDDSGADGGGGGATTIRIGQAEGPKAHLDMLVVQDAQTDAFAWNVYEGLTQLQPDGELAPKLATEWSAEGNTWTFTIRSGVKFHEGETLTANDVVASYERFLDPNLKATLLGQLLSDVTSMTAPNANTVVIETEAFNPTIPAQLQVLPIVPADWAESEDKRLETRMNGTGPYKLVSYTKGRGVELARFDGYWGDKASYETARFRFIADPAVRLAALDAGEIDMAVDLPPSVSEGAEKTISSPVSEVMIVRMNALLPPLDDTEIRRAVNLAIDRETICEQLYGGRCTFTKSQPIVPEVFGFNDGLEEYPYDPDEARQILEDAGAVGTELTFSVPVGRWPNLREVGQAIASQLTEAGFRVTPSFMDLNQWVEQLLAAQTNPAEAYSLSVYGTSNDYLESSYSFEGLIKCGAPVGAYCNEEIDETYQRARSQVSEDERRRGYEAAWAAVSEDHAVAPLFSALALSGAKEGVEWEPIVLPWVLLEGVHVSAD